MTGPGCAPVDGGRNGDSLRTRLVIPAAILMTAAYVKGRLDAAPLAPRPQPALVVVPAPVDPARRAEAEAADAMAIAEAQIAASGTLVEREAEPEVEESWLLSEWMTAPAPAADGAAAPAPGSASETPPAATEPADEPTVELVIEADGRFCLGGWSAQAGHMALCGVTFRDRRGGPLSADRIRLVPDASTNVAEGGLVVLSDAGFAPDAEGFTILLAAAGPGAFAAAGRYEVLSPG